LLKGLGSCYWESVYMKKINLINPIPPTKQVQIIRWLQLSCAACISAVVLMVTISVYYYHHVLALKSTCAHKEHFVQQCTSLEHDRAQIAQQVTDLQTQLHKVESWHQPKSFYLGLTELTQLIPASIALTRYHEEKREIVMEGLAHSFDAVVQFIAALNTATYFQNAELVSVQQLADNTRMLQIVIKAFVKKL
jgi:Tfp pilus assembly protein PilN